MQRKSREVERASWQTGWTGLSLTDNNSILHPLVPLAVPQGQRVATLWLLHGAVEERVEGQLLEQLQITPAQSDADKGYIEIIGERCRLPQLGIVGANDQRES